MAEHRFDPFQIEDRVVLITGATGHLGSAMSTAVSSAGGIPVIAARSINMLEALSQQIRDAGGECQAVVLDVSQSDQCVNSIAQITERFGRLDGIVNCANHSKTGTIDSTTSGDFAAAWAQNVGGPFMLIRAAIPLLRVSGQRHVGGASIVNIASMYGHVSPDPRVYESGKNNPPFYGSAKAGMLQLTRYLAVHLGAERIRVNSISPGPFPPQSIQGTDPSFHSRLSDHTALRRTGSADELVGPVLFLLSDAASYVTGADLAVDGGWTAW